MNMGSAKERAQEFCHEHKPDLSKIVDNLSRLECFKRVGQNRYVACYPALHDKNPSLSITQPPEEALVQCFAGCEQWDVLQALTELGLLNRKSQNVHLDPHERYSRDEFEIMANRYSVTKLRKRKGEAPAEGESKVFYHYNEVPKLCLPEPKALISGSPR